MTNIDAREPSSAPLALSSARRRDWVICAVVYLFALSVGVTQFFRPLPGSEAAFQIQGAPWSDALMYDRAAVDLKDGLGLRETSILTLKGVRTPGYITFLAAVYQYVGHRPVVVRLLQINMVALVCVIVYLLGALSFSRAVGATAALGLAMYQPMHGFANVLVAEVPLICALSLSLLGVLTCEGKPVRSAVAGVWAGISVAIKSVGMLPLAGMILYLLWRQRKENRGKALKAPLAFVVGAGVVLVPLVARNWSVLGSPTLVSTGNIWFAWACHVHPARSDSEQAWADAVFATRDEKTLRTQLQKETRAALRAHRLRTLARLGGEAIVYYGLPFRQFAPLDFLVLPLLTAGVLIGIARRHHPPVVLLAITALSLIFGHVLTLDNPPRYRLISDWLILLLAVGGLAHWLRMLAGISSMGHSETESPVSPSFSVVPIVALSFLVALMALPAVKTSRAHLRPAQDISARPISQGDLARLFGSSVEGGTLSEKVSSLTFPEYRRHLLAHRGDLSSLDGKIIVWHGVIEPLAVLAANQDDWRGSIFAKRPYARTIATFRVDGARGRDSERVWLEIPESVSRFKPNVFRRAWVLARVDTNAQSLFYQRYRLVAIAIHPEA